MKPIVSDERLVAFCGLYCGACRRYRTDSCPGCRDNLKATWCKIRSCCLDQKYSSCADCRDFSNVQDCRKFNNAIAKIFAWLFRSNRPACIEQIRTQGRSGHADIMSAAGKHSLPR